MNYNHSPDQRYFYCTYCPFEMKGEWKHKQPIREKHGKQNGRDFRPLQMSTMN